MFEGKIDGRRITQYEISRMKDFEYAYMEGSGFLEPHVWVKVFYDEKNKVLYVLDEIFIYDVGITDILELIKIKKCLVKGSTLRTDTYFYNIFEKVGLNVDMVNPRPDLVIKGIHWLKDLNKIIIDKDNALHCLRGFSEYKTRHFIDGKTDMESYLYRGSEPVHIVRYAISGYVKQTR